MKALAARTRARALQSAGKPYNGVCTLRVHNTWMLQHIDGAIQEDAGFEEPSWLR
jgi:hypothetical protein